jgi:putative FmdB family regulatory protein
MLSMPVYDYRAEDPEKAQDCCREPFEVVQKLADAALEVCPTCGTAIVKVIGAVGFSTKGQKTMMSDKNLKRNGFQKLVKEGDGKYRNVLA